MRSASTPYFAMSLTLATLVLAATLEAADPPSREAIEQFEREVRPIFVAACAECHGAKKQEGGLRVDGRAALLRGGDRGPALVPGSAEQSLLVSALRHEGDLKMPPKKPLEASKVAAIRRWIDAGAHWPAETASLVVTRGGAISDEERSHWSFQPIRRTTVPDIGDSAWALSPADRFVRQALDRQELSPASAADRRTLLRRLRLALTGLPPSRDEQREFLADDAPDATARLVDRLLADPAQGERWGRHWLDVVRYADTAGDGADYPIREAYRYRNYVVRSMAADKPFDQFVREQLAGDLLARDLVEANAVSPERYEELVVATGYLAVAKRFGYNVNTEFQHLDMADVIEGFGRSLLGLSIGCARCHDHKFDPLNMADYYSLYGMFASSQFAFPGGEEHKRPAFLSPLLPPADVKVLEQARAAEVERVQSHIREHDIRRAALAAQLPNASGGEQAFETNMIGKPPATPWFQAGPNVVMAEAQSPFANTYAAGSRGVRMESGSPSDGVRWELKTPVTTAASGQVHFNIDFRNVTKVEAGGGAYRLYLGDGAIRSLAIEIGVSSDDVAIRSGGTWEVIRKIEMGVWYNLRLTVDLTRKQHRGSVVRFGAPEDIAAWSDKSCAPDWNGRIDTFFCDGIGHRQGPRPTRDLDNLAFQTAPLAPPAAVPQLSADALTKLRADIAAVEKSITQLRAEADVLAKRSIYPLAYAVAEGKPSNVRIQKRGEPDRLGDEAPRRNLEILGGEPLTAENAARGSGRRELAEWIARPTNPLTARVIANRVWQHLFGTGIVATESDFGTRGEPPTHPELLDDLAWQLVDSGWSLKRLQRDLVLSRTWQLSSDGPAANQERDPANRWLWRHSRRPLDAESVRDGMLWASGQLDRSIPGPHPFPAVESWGFSIHYPFEAVYDSAHRSVYLMVQRQRKQPYLSLFDGADPNISTARRLPTTTPTQALFLMNSPFVHRQATELARRLISLEPDDAARVRAAFELIVSREAGAAEADAARGFLDRYRRQGAMSGMQPAAVEEAAWSGFVRVLLTSNGFLFVE